MKLHNLAPLMVTGALLAPAANAQHKTGLDFQFDLGLTNKQDDKTVEGDKTSLQFKQRRARWWLGGKFQDKFSYKFRFDFKSALKLSYVKAGYKLSDATSVTFGTGFDPIPLISVAGDSYRMSDANVGSEAADAFNTGDVGVQLATDIGVGKLKFGLANGSGVTGATTGYTTQLDSFVAGAAFEGGFGIFSPYIGIGIQNTPSEKVKATNNEFSGRNDMDLSIGAGVDLGATGLFFNFARHEEGESTLKNNGVELAKDAKTEIQGIELKASQSFTSKLEGNIHFAMDTFKADGKKTGDKQQIGAQLFMYPYGHDKAYFTFSLVSATDKPEGGKDSTTNKAIVTFSARPSFALGK